MQAVEGAVKKIAPIPAQVGSSQADLAFEAHATLIKAELHNPALRKNPFWTLLRQDAYERFGIELARCGDGN